MNAKSPKKEANIPCNIHIKIEITPVSNKRKRETSPIRPNKKAPYRPPRVTKQENDKKTSYACRQENCQFTADSHRDLLSHNREIHAKKKYSCEKCDFNSFREDVLKVHFEREHLKKEQVEVEKGKAEEEKEDKKDETKGTILICEFCNIPYENIQNLTLHEINFHQIFRCNYKKNTQNYKKCSVLSSSVSEREKHIAEDHCYGYAWKDPVKGKSSKNANYTCKFCWKKTFIKRHYLIAHIENSCLKRSKKELAESQKQQKIKLAKDKLKHLHCHFENCDYKTNRQRNLELHELVHTKEKPFNCRAPNTSCNTKFAYPTLRTVHEWKEHKFSIDGKDLSSTFECSECDFVGQPSELKQHRQIHDKSREGRYECDTCGAKFKIKGTFNKHLKMHH